ncbi:MutS-related protein [Companilactobacillus halodurans]|uniref:DNA mismatch repair proteins mutS family domain-containing protein n=1 Tax=Companilactobacillus halodurans TaxID=2584183 RepID=A0A5P0ZM40_9LACO|nr:hypothetical protein [Companilactobacillus halodurans]MQS75246.1 hypothetical protein [Companilactobacillus halodurans]MQS97595.1 hypothetical protein [Companilactobacillus halodurans]
MKTTLISPDDLDLSEFKLTDLQENVVEDLELQPILETMSDHDKFLKQTILKIWFTPLKTESDIVYRQAAVQDAVNHPQEIHDLYQLILETIKTVRSEFWTLDSGSASYKLHSFARQIDIYLNYLDEVKAFNDTDWESDNFINFFKRLDKVFSKQSLAQMHELIDIIVTNNTYSFPVKLNKNFGSDVSDLDFTKKTGKFSGMMDSVKTHFEKREAKFVIAERDDDSSNALGHYDNIADFNLATKVVNTKYELEKFFNELKFQVGFLIGTVRLQRSLSKINLTYPKVAANTRVTGLKNVVLLVSADDDTKVVGNDLSGNDLKLVIISGTNQGGKTTTLRSLGQAQLMMDSGMYVFADSFQAPLFDEIFTHFKREEDTGLTSGKLDNELLRMSNIVQAIHDKTLILMNESFSSTNEHEGSQINAQVVSGLVNSGVTVISVTHQFEFSKMLQLNSDIEPIFLRPERDENGHRNFKLLKGSPLKTSFGVDIYDRVFGTK